MAAEHGAFMHTEYVLDVKRELFCVADLQRFLKHMPDYQGLVNAHIAPPISMEIYTDDDGHESIKFVAKVSRRSNSF